MIGMRRGGGVVNRGGGSVSAAVSGMPLSVGGLVGKGEMVGGARGYFGLVKARIVEVPGSSDSQMRQYARPFGHGAPDLPAGMNPYDAERLAQAAGSGAGRFLLRFRDMRGRWRSQVYGSRVAAEAALRRLRRDAERAQAVSRLAPEAGCGGASGLLKDRRR